jgi:hypothetical protein
MENAIQSLPVPTLPESVPVRSEPEVDPFRELRELAQTVRADCLVDPKTYLNQVRVTGGGE